MARAPVKTKKAVLAAATKINLESHDEVRRTLSQREDWQRLALEFYDSIGQLKHAVGLVADVLARVKFFVAEQTSDDEAPEPTQNTDATAPLDRLRDFSDGLPEIQREATLHYLVPGESYLIGLGPRDEKGKPSKEEGRERWFIASIDEVEHKSGRVVVKHPDTGKSIELVGKEAAERQGIDPDFWARMWRRHIRYGWKSDSPFRGILSDAEDYTLFGKLLRAAARTRLLFAGALLVPDDLELMTASPTDGDDSEDPEQDPFFAKLMEAMMAAMDENSMASVAPLLLRGDGELLGQVTSLIFDRPMDALLQTLRKDALDHIAQGLPLPVEFVFGLGEANHWGAGQIEESAFELYFAPIATWFANALTQGYLLPELRANGLNEPERYFVWYDAKALTRVSEKKDVALEAYTEGLISGATGRASLGYDEEDAPDEREREQRLEEMRLRRSRERNAPPTEPLTAAVQDPDLGQRLAEIDAELKARLEGATDAAMQRALEKAGNRIIGQANKDRALRASLNGTTAENIGKTLGRTVVASLVNVHDILDGAWTKLGDRFETWGAEAVDKSLDLAEMEELERQEAVSTLAMARNEAWKWLEAQLNETAVQILFGEEDEVPFDVIREAVARAGLA